MFIGYSLKKEGVKKPIVESIHRLETQVSTGRLVEKSRLIDRENDRYAEHIVDDTTSLPSVTGRCAIKPRSAGYVKRKSSASA